MKNDNINISSAESFYADVNSFSKNKIIRRDDLITLFKVLLENNKIRELENAAFTAKYINGLMRVLKKGSSIPEAQNLQQVNSDIAENINKFKITLNEILLPAGSKMTEYFQTNYFEMNASAFSNLTDLLSDLEWTKMYLNHKRRET